MQNLRITPYSPLRISRFFQAFRRTALGGTLLAASVMITAPGWGQIQPGTSTGAGTTTTQPGGLPGTAPAGRPGATLPNGQPVPGNLPGNRANLPNVPQQPGRTGTNQPGAQQQQQPGRTTQGTTPDGQPTADTEAVLDSISNERRPQSAEDVARASQESARLRERDDLRRKIFGFDLFSGPGAASTFEPLTNVPTPQNYSIGPGDQLSIQIYGYSDADFSQTVSPEGEITFSQQSGVGAGVGPVRVAGLTIEGARRRIIDRLATRYVGLKGSSPNTFLRLTLGGQIRSIRVTVIGDAIRPGTYTISSLSSVLNALYRAGGPNENGSFRRIQLIRAGRVVGTLDLYDLLLTGVQSNNPRLQDGDNIRIPPYIARVEVTGSARRNNIFEILPGETLERVLNTYAAGFAATAYKNVVKITRFTEREVKVVDVRAAEFRGFVMQDGDVVNVERILERYENLITLEGAVFRPGRYSLDQNRTLRQLIQNAEGLRGDAFPGRINITRTREDLSVENLSINLTPVLNGTVPDVPLQREDLVQITSRFDLAEAATLTITGEVNNPQPFIPYIAGMTLEDLLVRAGGLKESAAASQIEIVRRKRDVDVNSATAQIAETFRVSVNRDLSIGADSKFALQPFDQVVVRRSPNYQVQTYAEVQGEVLVPGEYPIRTKDQKISDLVTQAGGLTPQAYIEGATLIRPVRLSEEELAQRQRSVSELADNATDRREVVQVQEVNQTTKESVGINLKRILANPGSTEDILLQEGDVLVIPKRLETVRMQGEVLLPGTVKFRPNQTFQDYVSQAGGFSSRARRQKAFIVYANGTADRSRRFLFFNIYPRVEPGSEIVVPRRTTSPLSPLQAIQQASAITSSVIGLITLLLATRALGQ